MSVWVNASEYYILWAVGLWTRQAAVHTLELYSTVCTVLGRWLFIPSYSDSTVYGARQVALHTLLL